jgi:hypothetical protein
MTTNRQSKLKPGSIVRLKNGETIESLTKKGLAVPANSPESRAMGLPDYTLRQCRKVLRETKKKAETDSRYEVFVSLLEKELRKLLFENCYGRKSNI